MTIGFLILAVLAVGGALGVVISRNPVNSALCLILNLLAIAGLFATLEAHFLAVAQVIVYAGAIMVLFIFVIMLLNLKVEKPKPYSMVTTVSAVLAAGAFILVMGSYMLPIFGGVLHRTEPVVGSVPAIGAILYTRYTYPFEVASILIIVALAGAVMLARRAYRKEVTPDATAAQLGEKS